ncbi:hypothetical protein O6H91_12G047100 [Diphasiastrum complanatum]|uniref:Uncharacterized protein n=1 Tax=Diphasiastrum complanatum TaxID=34168 RepID=A0ACC2C181_DIPCM|nr:hypothetical protein O6H91_12G047100 [Diphasiastrum complanatum]
MCSVIVEALKMDSLQKLCSSLEPLLRRVVGEEVERALGKLIASKRGQCSSPKRIQGQDARNLRLQFRSKLALPLFTGSKVEGEHGSALHVVLIDAATNQIITSGSEASAKLEIVVLEGDFALSDENDWSKEEFESYEVREREGKRPLLTGDLSLSLKEGVGTLGEVTFTDNSSWIRSRKFRLGVKLAPGSCDGIRIREAKTEAFGVKDHRGELYKKHYPPALHDEVWRLDRIGKDGAFHKRLNQAGIFMVEDFLRFVVMDPHKLRNLVGSGMSNKMWEGTIEHAKTCVLGGKLYVYYADENQSVGVIFNNIFQLMGLIAGGKYFPAESLADSQKLYVDKLVKAAYEKWDTVVEYDGEALVDTPTYNTKGSNSQPEDSFNNYVTHEDNFQYLSSVSGDAAVSNSEDIKSIQALACHNNTLTTGSGSYPELAHPGQTGMQPAPNSVSLESKVHPDILQNFSAIGEISFDPTEVLVSQARSIDGTSTSNLSLVPLETDWFFQKELQRQASQLQDYYLEEEIRQKSLEMLENEDIHVQMQQLFKLFNAGDVEQFSGVLSSTDMHGCELFASEGFPSPSEKRVPSGRAYVSWLKLKTALRWGIFIRKKAAARRAQAQIVEIDDD